MSKADKQISIPLPMDLYEQLSAIARQEKRSRRMQIREWIMNCVADYGRTDSNWKPGRVPFDLITPGGKGDVDLIRIPGAAVPGGELLAYLPCTLGTGELGNTQEIYLWKALVLVVNRYEPGCVRRQAFRNLRIVNPELFEKVTV